ncbi:MAG: VWA domain-containing protein [Acidobacteriota bacterium]
MARKLLLVFLAMMAVATLAISQQSKQASAKQGQSKAAPIEEADGVIRGGVDLVNVLCTVRGKNGALLGSLEKSDFKVFEDGKEQEIKYFTKETNVPLTIGLLVDVSGSMDTLIPTERRAGGQFFNEVLRKDDLAFIISFGKDSELLQDSTNSLRLLQRGLDDLKLNAPVGMNRPGPVPTIQNQAGTVLYDAVYLAAEDRLRKEAGRKVIVLITDGEDTGSKTSRQEAIEAAQKSDVIIYSIFYSAGFGSGNEGVLKRMSEETGGRVFQVDRRLNLADIFKQIQDEMRTQYSVSYSPANTIKDGGFRKLEFKMANKDYKVQARKGYYAIEGDR